jgi:anti-sigma-K factor RskA
MNEQDMERRLNDYVDGLLSQEEARAVERELEAKPELRKAEAELRSLLANARSLPKSIEPDRDLWEGIQKRLQPKWTVSRPKSKRFRLVPILRWALPVAAAATVLVISGLNLRTGLRPEPVPPSDWTYQGEDLEVQLISAELQKVEADHQSTVSMLRQALDESKESLSPETVEVIEENLEIIEQATEEIRAALKEDPGNERLFHSLVATYNKEVDLLQQAVHLPEAA